MKIQQIHNSINTMARYHQERAVNYAEGKYAMHYIISLFPRNIIEKIQMDVENAYRYMGTLGVQLTLYFPWDDSLIKEVDRIFEGWSRHEYMQDNMSSLKVMYKKAGLSIGKIPVFDADVDCVFSAAYKQSTCVLVPIEVETVKRVKTYDRICPDSHPELFEEKDGKLVYVGDNLFPKLEVE